LKKILTILAAILPPAALILSPFFLKVNIDCKSQYGECPQEVIESLGKANGKTLKGAGREVAKVLAANPLISGYSTQYKLSGTLLVNILLKKPAFALIGADAKVALVSPEGEVLSHSDSSSLPRVRSEGSVPAGGEKVSEANLTALKIIGGIYEMYRVDVGAISGESLIVELPGRIRVLFPLDGDPQVLLGAVRLIYAKVTADGEEKKYSEIDLRFQNPVLR